MKKLQRINIEAYTGVHWVGCNGWWDFTFCILGFGFSVGRPGAGDRVHWIRWKPRMEVQFEA
jgi:hypothetical protein